MAHMRAVEAMLFALLEPKNSLPESNIPPRWGKKRYQKYLVWTCAGHICNPAPSEHACRNLTQKFSPFLYRVLNMMRTAVGRHFGLMVGESRTSGAQTVRQLMTESVTQKLPRINFPQDLLVKYRNSFQMGSRRGGEELCDALLQAIAFYELLSDCSWEPLAGLVTCSNHTTNKPQKWHSEFFWTFFFLWTFWRLMISLKN